MRQYSVFIYTKNKVFEVGKKYKVNISDFIVKFNGKDIGNVFLQTPHAFYGCKPSCSDSLVQNINNLEINVLDISGVNEGGYFYLCEIKMKEKRQIRLKEYNLLSFIFSLFGIMFFLYGLFFFLLFLYLN